MKRSLAPAARASSASASASASCDWPDEVSPSKIFKASNTAASSSSRRAGAPPAAKADLVHLLSSPSARAASSRLLTLLPPPDLAALGQTSKRANGAVLNWVLHDAGARTALLPNAAEDKGCFPAVCFSDRPDSPLRPSASAFSALGRLFKRLTCARPTQERLETAWGFLRQVRVARRRRRGPCYSAAQSRRAGKGADGSALVDLGAPLPLSAGRTSSSSASPSSLSSTCDEEDEDLILLRAKASFVFALARGWHRQECRLALAFALERSACLLEDLRAFSAPRYALGSDCALEVRIRRHVRIWFWDEVPPPERSVWLDLLLRHVCGGVDLIRQSRLLFLIFGPTKTFRYGVGGGGTSSAAVVQCGGSGGGGGGLIEWVMWKEVSEPLEEDRGGTEVAFKPLADALAKCHMMRSRDDLYRLLRFLFRLDGGGGGGGGCEGDWDVQNVASLLLLSTPYVRHSYLTRKMLDDPCEISDVLVQMLLQGDLLGSDLHLAVFEPVEQVLRLPDVTCCTGTSVVDGIWSALTEMIRGASGNGDPGAGRGMLLLAKRFGLRLMNKAYNRGGGNNKEKGKAKALGKAAGDKKTRIQEVEP